MSLYSDWRNYLENLTDDQAEGFQHDYYEQEEKLYQKLKVYLQWQVALQEE